MGLTVFLFVVAVVASVIALRRGRRIQVLEEMRTLILRKLPAGVLREPVEDILLWSAKLLAQHKKELERSIRNETSDLEIQRIKAVIREVESDFYKTYDERVRLLDALGADSGAIMRKRHWEEYASTPTTPFFQDAKMVG